MTRNLYSPNCSSRESRANCVESFYRIAHDRKQANILFAGGVEQAILDFGSSAAIWLSAVIIRGVSESARKSGFLKLILGFPIVLALQIKAMEEGIMKFEDP